MNEEFYKLFCPFGAIDVNVACDIARKVCVKDYEFYDEYVMDAIEEWEFQGVVEKRDDIDIVACVLEYTLGQASAKIEEVLGFGLSSLNVYSNYSDSQLDSEGNWSECVSKLQNALDKATEEQKEELRDDAKVMYILNKQIGVNF